MKEMLPPDGTRRPQIRDKSVDLPHPLGPTIATNSPLDKVKLIEDMGYDNLVISIKSSDVMMCVKAHELIAKKTHYPLHVGITGYSPDRSL